MKFTKRAIEAVEAQEKRQTFFDDAFTGLALLVTKTGKKTFYYTYRVGKGRSAEKKWLMLGTFPVMSIEQARDKAKNIAAKVLNGIDPVSEMQSQKNDPIMQNSLCIFCEEYYSKVKPGTAHANSLYIKKHIVPYLGKLHVKDVTYSKIAKLHHNMIDYPAMANRCVSILSTFFNWCELHGYRERKTNPCSDIKKYKENKRLEFLSATELAILGSTLERMERTWHERKSTRTIRKRCITDVDTMTPQSAAVIRLLMLTGARKNEILSLEWRFIDFEQGVARLPDSKTGFKVLQLPTPALVILNNLEKSDKWVFPSSEEMTGWPGRTKPRISRSGHMCQINVQWNALLKQAGLTGWRVHDLRHAFASMMVNGGASLPIIGKILGHTQASTTQRYAHLEQNPARKAAEDAAAKIAQAWASKPQEGKVIEFPKAQ